MTSTKCENLPAPSDTEPPPGPSEETHCDQPNHTSLITRLPTEILHYIFEQCIQVSSWSSAARRRPTLRGSDTIIPFPHPHPDQPPLLFTRVSKRWRAVSLSTPGLWTSIPLFDGDFPQRRNSRRLQSLCTMLEVWLCNARSRPLGILLRNPPHLLRKGLLWQKILPVFIRHASHWSILVAAPSLANDILTRNVDMPMLKTFWSPGLIWPRLKEMLRLSPQLTCLCMATFDAQCLPPAGVARGLQYLEITKCHYTSDVLGILECFPELLTVKVDEFLHDRMCSKQITHRKLEELVVSHVLVISSVVEALCLPSLRSLVVGRDWDTRHMQSVRSLLSRSSCDLHYLEFSFTFGFDPVSDIDDKVKQEVEQLLRFTPQVRVHQTDFRRPLESS